MFWIWKLWTLTQMIRRFYSNQLWLRL